MRKKLPLQGLLHYCLVGLFCMLGAFSLHAQLGQTNWKFSNPKPVGFTITYMSFYDDNNGIAVGGAGCIAKTTDAGQTWKYGVFSYTDAAGIVQRPSFSDVHFVTPTVAYAAGGTGILIKSTDGGLNWNIVSNPLLNVSRNLNAVWFLNKDTGYIGGQSLIDASSTAVGTVITSNMTDPNAAPKLYFTKNGGATWDSLIAPIGDLTNMGFVNAPSAPSLYPTVKVPIRAAGKEIYRIKFVNDSIGYVVGSLNNTSERYQNTATTTTTSNGNYAALVWKFRKGILYDYSLSKERCGYSGILPSGGTLTATTAYSSNSTPGGQNLKAFTAINDSAILIATFNNNMIVRVKTGINDSTAISTQTAKSPGIYEVVYNVQPPNGYPLVPSTGAVFSTSNIVSMDKSAINGGIFMNGGQGRAIFTTDAGTTWKTTQALPASTNFTTAQTYGLDITPNGRVIIAGADGAMADSLSGVWTSAYKNAKPGVGYNQVDFADCNNGAAMGGNGAIQITTDGGQNWTDKTVASFAASLISIYGMSYQATNKLYFSSSNGNIYMSPDQATSNNLIFSDPLGGVSYGMASFGSRIWGLSWRGSQANEKLVVFRSFNNGLTWDTAKGFPTGANAPLCQTIKFVSQDTGYISGYKGKVFKTIDGGINWTDVSPSAAVATASTNAMGVYDRNTVYVYQSAFPNKYLFKTTDGGATWTNIMPTMTNYASANITGFILHDANTVFAIYGGGRLLKTTDGGTTWAVEEVPTAGLLAAGVFVPKTVPAGTPASNRKMFIVGGGTPVAYSQILEYGTQALINTSSTESITNANCTNLTAGAVTVNAVGGIAPYTYSLNGSAFQSANTFTGLTQGAKTLIVKDAGCQTVTKTITIGFTDNLTLTTTPAVDTSVCAGAPVPLVATSAASATYSWTPVSGLSNNNTANTTATVNANASYTVTASLNGCVRTKIIPIKIKANPVISAGPDKTIVQGDAVILNGSGGAGVITWTPFGTLVGANTYTPTATPTVSTLYTLKVVDNNSCTSTDDVLITVIPYCLKPMAAFTPNNDGINDKWLATVGGACTIKVSATVYNRYGNAVYKNDNYQNDWDGKYKGEPLPDGTYYYSIIYQLINGNSIVMKGDLTILR